MIQQAREMIATGELGDLIAVRTTYLQGWMNGDSHQHDSQWCHW
jgi:predicted dehydrogenase